MLLHEMLKELRELHTAPAILSLEVPCGDGRATRERARGEAEGAVHLLHRRFEGKAFDGDVLLEVERAEVGQADGVVKPLFEGALEWAHPLEDGGVPARLVNDNGSFGFRVGSPQWVEGVEGEDDVERREEDGAPGVEGGFVRVVEGEDTAGDLALLGKAFGDEGEVGGKEGFDFREEGGPRCTAS